MIIERRTLVVTVVSGGTVEFKLPKKKFPEGEEMNERIRRCSGRPRVDNPCDYMSYREYEIGVMS